MPVNPNGNIAVRYFEALRSKDLRAVPLATDEVMESPVTPRLTGMASVLEYLEALASIAKTIRTLDFIAEGATIVAMVKSRSVIALSLPEAVILRKVLKPRLIAVFFGVVACGILVVGYLFNFLM